MDDLNDTSFTQIIDSDENEEDLTRDHSGFEHYCNHHDAEDDTFIQMVLAAK